MKVKAKNPGSGAFDVPEKAAIETYINNNAQTHDLDFDAIRANVLGADKTPDGHIHQIALDLGFEVES